MSQEILLRRYVGLCWLVCDQLFIAVAYRKAGVLIARLLSQMMRRVRWREKETISGTCYPLKGKPVNGVEYITVAFRPETMLGDTGVAVSPQDRKREGWPCWKDRYHTYDCGREIPIFWLACCELLTGFVKALHDLTTLLWVRHCLEQINIFDEHAVVVDGYGEFSVLIKLMRAIVASFLKSTVCDHVEDLDHSVTCIATAVVLRLSRGYEQWFVALISSRACNLLIQR